MVRPHARCALDRYSWFGQERAVIRAIHALGREPQEHVANGRWQPPQAIAPIGLRAYWVTREIAASSDIPEEAREPSRQAHHGA